MLYYRTFYLIVLIWLSGYTIGELMDIKSCYDKDGAVEVEPIEAHNHGWPSIPESELSSTDFILDMLEMAEEGSCWRDEYEESINQKDPRLIPTEWESPDVDECVDMYYQGYSIYYIARHLGVSSTAVWVKMRDAGTEMRPSTKDKKKLD